MLCLGTDDTILPHELEWANNHIDVRAYRCNILGAVLKAISSVLLYAKLLSAKDFTASECKNLQHVGEMATIHAMYVLHLKQAILQVPLTPYQGVKIHAVINHIHIQVMLFGSPKFTDTVPYEHQHAEDGVAAVKQTSRRGSMNAEMLTTVYYEHVFKYLRNCS